MHHRDPFDIAGQARTEQEAQERLRLIQQIEIDDLKWLMSNKRGRRFAYRLLEVAGVWRLSFHTNALTMAFNEGLRNTGLWLVNALTTHCPDRYFEMLKESKE